MTHLKKYFAAFVLILSGIALLAPAQDNDFGFPQDGNQEPKQVKDPLQDPLSDPLNSGFGNFGAPPGQGAHADFDAKFVIRKGQNKGLLLITGRPDKASHSHLYSQRSDLEYQMPTVFKVTAAPEFQVVGKFNPDRPPKFVRKESGKEIWETEEFSEDVTWSAPITVADGVDVEKLEITTQIIGQVCNDGGCNEFNDLFVTAKFEKYLESGPYRSTAKGLTSNKVEWTGTASTKTIKPGDTFKLSFKAKVDEGWHLYGPELLVQDSYSPTVIVLNNSKNWTSTSTISTPDAKMVELGEFIQYHLEGEVTFSTDVTISKDAPEGNLTLVGKLGFQTCKETCKNPTVADFQLDLLVAAKTDKVKQSVVIADSDAKYEDVLATAIEIEELRNGGEEPFVLSTFLWYCGISFLAGLILNVMPCVLPVIGLKMMSFIEQAGEKRGRIFALNVAFSLGLMSVFWLLGFLVVIMDFGWGDLLNKGLTGVIVASGIVFAFGLSMMGVWEIPIPGFASSTHASKLAEKEGLGGAFVKGILTTVLATPCVGPLLIPAMTFAVGQSSFVGFAIFTVLGIGMAFPFLLVAVFPGAIKLLPKPGAWMDTFKQVMGFVLLGTVLFLLSTFAKPSEQNTPYVLPVMFMLLMIGVGCWWIGRTSIAAELKDKVKAYIVGGAIIAAGTWGGFYVLGPPQYELDWQPYSNNLLAELRKEGKPVFIDFTGPG